MSTQEKVKVHTQYKLANGQRVPSVTTVLNVLAKPALIQWAWQCGIDGKDWKAVRDSAGDVGSLVHYLIMCHLTGQEPDTSEYSAQAIDQAESCLIRFWDWEKEHDLKGTLIETPLVSEIFKFGGTPDWYGLLDDVPTLIDFKTSKGIYTEFFYQLGAYKALLEEQGHPVQTARILRIGRDEVEGFEERTVNNFQATWKVFSHCLSIYQLQKEVR
jgi:hypothetical protein